nr:F-box/kelch-repeat protein At3g23880-like [Ipomoea trifida]
MGGIMVNNEISATGIKLRQRLFGIGINGGPCDTFMGLQGNVLIHMGQMLWRLPVKPLMRFQCVSKAWLAMISSPDFVKTLLDLHKSDKEDKLVTFSATDDDGVHLSLFFILVEEN